MMVGNPYADQPGKILADTLTQASEVIECRVTTLTLRPPTLLLDSSAALSTHHMVIKVAVHRVQLCGITSRFNFRHTFTRLSQRSPTPSITSVDSRIFVAQQVKLSPEAISTAFYDVVGISSLC